MCCVAAYGRTINNIHLYKNSHTNSALGVRQFNNATIFISLGEKKNFSFVRWHRKLTSRHFLMSHQFMISSNDEYFFVYRIQRPYAVLHGGWMNESLTDAVPKIASSMRQPNENGEYLNRVKRLTLREWIVSHFHSLESSYRRTHTNTNTADTRRR